MRLANSYFTESLGIEVSFCFLGWPEFTIGMYQIKKKGRQFLILTLF